MQAFFNLVFSILALIALGMLADLTLSVKGVVEKHYQGLDQQLSQLEHYSATVRVVEEDDINGTKIKYMY
jgi:hypothetical protein